MSWWQWGALDARSSLIIPTCNSPRQDFLFPRPCFLFCPISSCHPSSCIPTQGYAFIPQISFENQMLLFNVTTRRYLELNDTSLSVRGETSGADKLGLEPRLLWIKVSVWATGQLLCSPVFSFLEWFNVVCKKTCGHAQHHIQTKGGREDKRETTWGDLMK